MKNNLTLLVLFLSICVQAQITTGSLEMKFEDIKMKNLESSDENAQAQMGAIFEQMKMTMYFKPELAVTKMNMMGMMDMTIFVEGGTQTQYMDMMGQKMKIVTDQTKQLSSLGIKKEDLKNLYKTTTDKNDTKEILGFTCYKTTVTMDMSNLPNTSGDLAQMPPEMKKVEMTFYVTDDIKIDNYMYQQMPGFTMTGAPLEMNFDMGLIQMVMRASSFSKEIDESVFDIPKGEYKEMTAEELQKLGMNPNGFGF